jgi:hypothetical protein
MHMSPRSIIFAFSLTAALAMAENNGYAQCASATVYTVSGGGAFCFGSPGVTITLSGSETNITYRLRRSSGTYTTQAISGTGGPISWTNQQTTDTYTVVGIHNITSCVTNMSGSATVTSNGVPSAFTFYGAGTMCTADPPRIFSTSGSQVGINYYLQRDGTNIGSPVAGSGSAISWPGQTVAGTYSYLALNPTTGCSRVVGSAVLTVVQTPVTYTLSGGGSMCSGGTGFTLTLNGTEVGVNYLLKQNSANYGSNIAGTGSPLTWTNVSGTGNYTVLATRASYGCTATMAGTAVVTNNQSPVSYYVSGGGTRCSDGPGLSITTSGSQVGINYQAKVNGVNVGSLIAGTGAGLTFPNNTAAGTYSITAIDPSTGCSTVMPATPTISVVQTPTNFTLSGGATTCGTAVTLTLSGSEIGVYYQLKYNTSNYGSAVSGTGGPLSWTNIVTSATYTVFAYRNGTISCSITSNSQTVTNNLLPAQYSVGGGGARCSDGPALNISLTGSESGINYQLKIDGVNSGSLVAGTGAALTWTNKTAAGVYTIVGTNASTGCVATMNGSATISVIQVPVTYTLSGGGAFCSANPGLTLALSGSETGVSYQLKQNTTNYGTAVSGTGSPISWPNITTAATYSVVASKTGCVSTTNTQIIINNPTPSAPVPVSASRCGSGTVTLTATAGSNGDEVKWYTASTGGSAVQTGLSYSPSLSSTTTYYVSTYNSTTGCESASRATVVATIHADPGVPTAPVGAARCGSGAVTLSATIGANGNTLRWYTTSTGGTALSSGTAYTTPALSNTTVYYVSTYSTTTGCESSTRTSVTATINPEPGASTAINGSRCGSGVVTLGATLGTNGNVVRWWGVSSGGSIITTGTSFTTPSISATTTYYISTYNSVTGCESTGSRVAVVATVDPGPPAPTGVGASRCGTGSVTLTATPGSGGTTVYWYTTLSGGTPVFTGTSFSTPSLAVTTTYYISTFNSASSCEGLAARAQVVATINPLPNTPVATHGARCGPGTVTLSGTVGTNGNTIQWYSAPTGGSPLATGTSFTTPSLSASAAYYISSLNSTTGCESPSRVVVNATVNAIPSSPTTPGNASRCGTGTVVLSATVGSNGNSLRWYSAATGGTQLFTGAPFTTPSISATTTFYATTFNTSTGCESTTARLAVIATVLTDPGSPTAPVHAARCGQGTLTLSASIGTNGTTLRWYATTTGGSALFTGTSFTTPSISATTVYYASTYNATTGCENSSGRIAVTATVNSLPVSPVVTNVARCGSGSITLTAAPVTGGEEVRWYADQTGGSALGTGNSFNTPSLTSSANYYVSIYNTVTTCESQPRTLVAAIINSVPEVPTTTTFMRCGTGSITLTATPGSNGNVIRWYSASTGGTLITEANSYTTPSISATTNYYISSFNTATGCESNQPRIMVAATVSAFPIAPTASATARYGPGPVTLVASPGANGTSIRWYTAATGGSPLADGNSFITPELSANTSYYATSISNGIACESSGARLAVQAIIHPDLGTTSYSVNWTEPANVTVNANNSLFKTGASAWDGGAVSENTLKPMQDGWMEFTVSSSSQSFMAGLARLNSDATYTTLDYSFYLASTSLAIYEYGASRGSFGAVVIGDRLRIARTGTQITYSKNGTVIRTVTTTPSWGLRIDAALSSGFMPPVICSFDKVLSLSPAYIFPNASNTGGAVSVNVSGGTPPYTYLWNSGQTSESITNLSRGDYTLTVTDAVGRSASKLFQLRHDVVWVKPVNVVTNSDGSLTRNGTLPGWDAGVSSLNYLFPNADGWAEVFYSGVGNKFVLGFSKTDRDVNLTTVDYGLNIQDGLIYVYEGGANRGIFGAAMKGDIFRIAKESGAIKYYQNDVLLRSVVVSAAIPFLIDVSINQGTVPVVNTSIERKFLFTPTLTFPLHANTGGAISVAVSGGYAPVTYQWSPGTEQLNNIANKPRGFYTLTATDAAGRTNVATYGLGYPVVWTDLQSTTLNASNQLTKRNAGTAFDAGAISAATLPANTDGWIEFVISNNGNNSYMLGLAKPNSLTNTLSIDNGFYIVPTGEIYVRELGSSILVGYFRDGDILKVSREASEIKYYWNGTLVRTIATNAANTLIVDSVIGSGFLPVVSSSFSRTPQTFYAIASGSWVDGNIWSLTDGGTPALMHPAKDDVVNIKGHTVTVQTGIQSKVVNIIVTTSNTCLKVDGVNSVLNVFGHVNLSGQGNTSPSENLVVKNDGKISILLNQ